MYYQREKWAASMLKNSPFILYTCKWHNSITVADVCCSFNYTRYQGNITTGKSEVGTRNPFGEVLRDGPADTSKPGIHGCISLING